jgi:hypothetical protein
MSTFRCASLPLGAPGRDSQPISVRVFEVALAAGQAILVYCDTELFGHRFNVVDVEMKEGVGPSITLVLRKVDSNSPSGHRHEPGKPRFKLVLPLFRKAQPRVPRNRACSILDPENRNYLFFHDTRLPTRSHSPIRGVSAQTVGSSPDSEGLLMNGLESSVAGTGTAQTGRTAPEQSRAT